MRRIHDATGEERRQEVLLFTGGLDSVLIHALLDGVPCLYVILEDLVPGETTMEAQTVGRLWEALDLDLDVTSAPLPALAQSDGHIPLRNLHLCTIAALITDNVYLGAVRGESSPDKSEAFLRRTSAALTQASQGRTIKIDAPAKNHTKRELVKLAIERLGRPEAERRIAMTRSCYSRDRQRCGQCMACFRRWVALSLNGIHEEHDVDPWRMPQPSWGARARYLRLAPAREWPGIMESNLEAAAALDRARRGSWSGAPHFASS